MATDTLIAPNNRGKSFKKFDLDLKFGEKWEDFIADKLTTAEVKTEKEMWKKTVDVNFGNELIANDEVKAWKTIWSAGQGITKIGDNPKTSILIARLRKEFKIAIETQSKLLSQFNLD